MSKPTTQTKMKYNRASYKRYEFNVRVESKLNAIIERYKQNPENNLSELIKSCLCDHFGIDRYELELTDTKLMIFTFPIISAKTALTYPTMNWTNILKNLKKAQISLKILTL